MNRLDASVAVRIDGAVYKLEQGHQSGFKPEGGGLLAWEEDFGPGYRIYCMKNEQGELIVLFGGGTKRQQQPGIDAAKDLMREYKRRKREAANATKEKSKAKSKKTGNMKKRKRKK